MGRSPTVYAAGPIVGCDYAEANDWRDWLYGQLLLSGITLVSPLRCEPLIGDKYEVGYDCPKFGTNRAIGAKNVFDVRNTDMTLAYLPKPVDGRRQSWGTMCELAGAYFCNKPTILVSDDPRVLEHPDLDAMSGWVLPNLEEAVDVIVGILKVYGE